MNRFIFIVLMLIMVGVLLSVPVFAGVEQEQSPLFTIATSVDVVIESEDSSILKIRANLTPTIDAWETVAPTYRIGKMVSSWTLNYTLGNVEPAATIKS